VSLIDCTVETLIGLYHARRRDLAQLRAEQKRLEQQHRAVFEELLRRGVKPARPRRPE